MFVLGLAIGLLVGSLATLVGSFILRELAAKKRDREFADQMWRAIEREAEEATWRERRPTWGRQTRFIA